MPQAVPALRLAPVRALERRCLRWSWPARGHGRVLARSGAWLRWFSVNAQISVVARQHVGIGPVMLAAFADPAVLRGGRKAARSS